MLTPANRVLVEFVLDHSGGEPVAKRIELYRALAATMSEADEAFAQLTRLADDLEAVDESHAQLLLNFRGASHVAPTPGVLIVERSRPSWWHRLAAWFRRLFRAS
jgi:hypothetical protein